MRLALLLLVACTHAPRRPSLAVDPQPVVAFADPARGAKLAAAFPALDRLVDAEREAQHIPGLAFGVVVDGALVHAHAVGVLDLAHPTPVDADTVFRIGSMTKTITSLAILQLRDRGLVTLDDPLTRWLPELAAIRYPTRDAVPFTIRHVLTHTSGLPPAGAFSVTRTDRDLTEVDMLADLGAITLAAPPGTIYAYSNFATSLLGLVIGRATHVRYRDWVSREILAPLGMRASVWDPEAVPAGRLATPYAAGPGGPVAKPRWRLGMAEAAGGLYSTLNDMARYAAFQLAAYPPRDDADAGPLRRSSVREAHAVQHATGLVVRPDEARAEGIGLAWWSYRSCELAQVVWHTGGTEGYRGAIHLLPEHGVALILLTNYVDTDSAKITDGALALLRASGGLVARTAAPSPAITRVVAALIALYAEFTQARYEALFAPPMRAAVPPAAVVELQTAFAKEHGACTTVLAIRADSAVAAHVAIGCERGHLEYALALDQSGAIIGASVTSHAEATPAPASQCVPKTSM